MVKGMSLSQTAHVLDYMRRAGVPVRKVGGASVVFGSPVYLEAMVTLALDELRHAREQN
jgi:hypothetical protein